MAGTAGDNRGVWLVCSLMSNTTISEKRSHLQRTVSGCIINSSFHLFQVLAVLLAEERSSRVVAAATIVAAHALVLYGLSLVGPSIKQVLSDAPVEVRFIAESQPAPSWQPPEVKAINTPQIAIPVPQVVEVPVVAESEHAITAPVQLASMVKASSEDRNTPRLISTVEYVREPAPRYPPQSRKLREQGLVVLRVLIDEKGAACSIEVETSSGHERLDAAAREAVSRAAFRPYVEDGSPRRAFVLIPIEFSLNRSSA
jgi:periplasmic protein TonB